MKTAVTARPVGAWLSLAAALYVIDAAFLHTGIDEEGWGKIAVAVGIVISAFSPRS